VKNLSDKDVILSEFSKTATRLKNKGTDLDGLHFGINDKIRNPRVTDIRSKINDSDYSEDDSETIPEGHTIWKPEDDFIKLYPDALNKISFRLSGAEAMTLIRLVPFIDYQSGMLKKEKKPLITKNIIDITKFSKVTVINIMAKLVEEKILSRNQVGRTFQFYANPYIFFKGKYINHTLLDMFKDYKKVK
jgi:hypothetical protein